ncbi:hypothetical protein [Longimicrobium sp.]|uniref:hypothetical protein n=1 Tax=Longimicrobium sp. TaxID=2029185 RepID=UPI002E310521|nr:hypothetical protein [Longimicrobium sp.]HEX6041011.1 hypothetical protein [Longimicrobium sp.]
MTTTDTDLPRLREDVARKSALAQRLQAVRTSLAAEQGRRKRLAERLRAEKEDLDRLEGMSLSAFLATLTGSRGERTERERQEYLAAKLAYDSWAAGVAALSEQEGEIQAELAALRDAEARYEAALAGRERERVARGGEGAARLFALATELGDARAAARELDEAANAASAAGKALDELIRLLDEAEELNRADFVRDDHYTTARKHERLGEARSAAGFAGQKLQRLRTELSDVRVQGGGLAVDVGEALSFADYFMDGLFVDWIVQRRIEQARERAGRTRGQVRSLTIDLRARASRAQEHAGRLEAERRALLESE